MKQPNNRKDLIFEAKKPYRNVSPSGGPRSDLLAVTIAGAAHRRPLEQHHLVNPGAPNGTHTGGCGPCTATVTASREGGPRLAPLPDGAAERGVAAADGAIARGGAAQPGTHGVHFTGASDGGGGFCSPPARR